MIGDTSDLCDYLRGMSDLYNVSWNKGVNLIRDMRLIGNKYKTLINKKFIFVSLWTLTLLYIFYLVLHVIVIALTKTLFIKK